MEDDRQMELPLEPSEEAAQTLDSLVRLAEQGYLLEDIDIPTTNEEIIDHGE